MLEELLFPFPWPYGTQLASYFASTTHEILLCCVHCSTSNLTPPPHVRWSNLLFPQDVLLSKPFLVQCCWNKEYKSIPKYRGCGKIFHCQIASQISLISFVTNPNHIIFGSLKISADVFSAGTFLDAFDLSSPAFAVKTNFRFWRQMIFRGKSTNFYRTEFAIKRHTLLGNFSELQLQELQGKQKSVVTINSCKIALFGQACLVMLAGKSETC